MRAARCSGASAVTGIIVVQLGQDAMPFGNDARSPGFTSATTSGTSRSLRNAAELSTTFAPAAAASGAHSAASGSSTSTITKSSPSKQPGTSTSHSTSPPANGSLRPSERGDAYARNCDTGNARSSRMRSISVPTKPVAPISPTLTPPLMRLLLFRRVEAERGVQGAHGWLDVVFGDHARDADRRGADHL